MQDKYKLVAAFLFFAIGLPLYAICVALNIPMILIIIICVILFFAVFLCLNNYKEKKAEKSRQIAVYDDTTNTLIIKTTDRNKLSGFLENVLIIQQAQSIQYKYNPASLEYVGVTLGGVSTGNFYVNEASISPGAFNNTGKYEFTIKCEGKIYSPREILLPDAFVSSASNTPIVKKFLKGNRLVLKRTNKATELTPSERSTIEFAQKEGRQDVVMNTLMRSIIASYLTKEECYAIKNWLCQ